MHGNSQMTRDGYSETNMRMGITSNVQVASEKQPNLNVHPYFCQEKQVIENEKEVSKKPNHSITHRIDILMGKKALIMLLNI